MFNIQKKEQINIFRIISFIAMIGIFLSVFLINITLADEDTSWGSLVFTVRVDSNPPVISHTPVKLVNVVGNKIVLDGNITDDTGIVLVSFYYKKHTDSEYIEVINVLNNLTDYDFKGEIPSEVITTDGVDYYITATDNAGNRSCFSDPGYSENVSSPVVPIEIEVVPDILAVTITEEGGTVTLRDGNPDDGETSLIIPVGALSEPAEISIKQILDFNVIPSGTGAAIGDKPVIAFEFSPDGLTFERPVILNLLYFDLDSDGIIDGTNIKEEELRIFWWDGYNWRYIGGKVDVVKNVLTVEITHFCIYALFPARELIASDYRPVNKIITPATVDGTNDVAVFDGLENKKITIKIFDVTGKKVKTISYPPYQWDGRDDEGRLVEGGVYIYQFEVDGELVSGVIAVAK